MASNPPFPGGVPQHEDFHNIPSIPPMHRLHPAAQPGTSFARMQQERHYGPASQPNNNDGGYQSPESRRQAAPSSSPYGRPSPETTRQAPPSSSPYGRQSPEFARKPVPASFPYSLLPAQMPVSREISPSPPMHPGMGPPVQRPNTAPWEHNRNMVPPAVGLTAVAMSGGPSRYAVDSVGQHGYPDAYSSPPPNQYGPSLDSLSPRNGLQSYSSNSSQEPLTDAVDAPGTAPFPGGNHPDYASSPNRYADAPVLTHTMSRGNLDNMVFVDPHAVADDGDDGLFLNSQDPRRASRLSFGRQSKGSNTAVNRIPPGAPGAAAAVGATGILNRNPSGNDISADGPNGAHNEVLEKSGWLDDNEQSRRKWLKWVFIALGIVVVLAIAGGAVGGILGAHKKNSHSSGSSANTPAGDEGQNGDLSISSSEIKALMNNPNLHKVFPGIDYTPLNAQYPDCLTTPADQNNVTRDMAVMSQLTNTVRLYGTDCNQTQMVLHSIDRLQFTPDQMQIWLGVWVDNNQTTSTRQMDAMYDILNQYGTKFFKGIILGNEVLFRQDMTAAALEQLLTETKANLTKNNIDLPLATSDLGDSWTQGLISTVDIVMANVHPFFGGVPADQAAGWTWNFWQETDVVLTKAFTNKQNIIAETGWPTQGGNDCTDSAGTATACVSSTAGAIAGVDELNTFMSGWVCEALTNGTEYFWFEAFDEPWKVMYDTPGKGWEDHWGFMDIDRNLKPGVKIPSCGGKTVA